MLAENTVLTGRRAITRSYAKINLTLDVLSKRENGYHDIKMIMQTVSLFAQRYFYFNKFAVFALQRKKYRL